MESIYTFKVKALNGGIVDFSSFKGRSLLIVNVASECGYTPQYEDLQMLHEQMGDKLAVIGFPANDFGGQEPGDASQIGDFCKKNYGVTFVMADKISVKGSGRHELYAWLSEKSGHGPNWNFCKYLVSTDGQRVKFFASAVNPFDEQIINEIN